MAAIAAAQQLFTYKDRSGSMTVQAISGLVEQVSTNKMHLVLKGKPVKMRNATDGVTIDAPSIVADANNSTKQTRIEKAVASGGSVTITKLAADGTTKITSGTATYYGGSSTSRATFTGRTIVISTTTKGKTTITGHNGSATFQIGAKGNGGGLKTADLAGPVRVESVQQNTNGGTIVATGSRLQLDNLAHTVTLSGNVNVTGNQESTLGELRGADRAVLVLNDRGQIASVRVTQGAGK